MNRRADGLVGRAGAPPGIGAAMVRQADRYALGACAGRGMGIGGGSGIAKAAGGGGGGGKGGRRDTGGRGGRVETSMIFFMTVCGRRREWREVRPSMMNEVRPSMMMEGPAVDDDGRMCGRR